MGLEWGLGKPLDGNGFDMDMVIIRRAKGRELGGYFMIPLFFFV